MQRLVDSESPGLAEAFAALLTLERLLFGVDVSEDTNRGGIEGSLQSDAMLEAAAQDPLPQR